MKIKQKHSNIEKLLEHYPHLRDNDLKLLATVWKYEVNEVLKQDYQNMSADSFLRILADGKLANPASVRRHRAKLQEHNPDLRGEAWAKRKKAQQSVKEEILNWSNEN